MMRVTFMILDSAEKELVINDHSCVNYILFLACRTALERKIAFL